MIASARFLQAFAPGRVELLGNHTDYNGGVVLSAALELGTTATGRLLPSGCRLRSEGFGEGYFLPSLEQSKPTGTWVDYSLGVISVFREAGYELPGVDIHYRSTIPLGAGLSSSAAIEVATAVLLAKLLDTSLPRLQIARMCRKAENQFVGVNCGLLDQVSSVFGESGHAIFLDCETETVETVPFPDDTLLLITDSGAPHRLAGGEYNERRAECFLAARKLGVANLRATTSNVVAAAASLPLLPRRRALHITGENERVALAVESLRAGDMVAVGKLMSLSHLSSIKNFENSSPELDALVEISRDLPGVLGSRLTGGGFGGATVTLVEESSAHEAAHTLSAEYLRRTGHTARTYVCRVGNGAT